jgi:hypothetical protein
MAGSAQLAVELPDAPDEQVGRFVRGVVPAGVARAADRDAGIEPASLPTAPYRS